MEKHIKEIIKITKSKRTVKEIMEQSITGKEYDEITQKIENGIEIIPKELEKLKNLLWLYQGEKQLSYFKNDIEQSMWWFKQATELGKIIKNSKIKEVE